MTNNLPPDSVLAFAKGLGFPEFVHACNWEREDADFFITPGGQFQTIDELKAFCRKWDVPPNCMSCDRTESLPARFRLWIPDVDRVWQQAKPSWG